jgi:hypothetical protein
MRTTKVYGSILRAMKKIHMTDSARMRAERNVRTAAAIIETFAGRFGSRRNVKGA